MIFRIILAHIIADYFLQNNWMAKNKKIGAADPCPEEDPMRSWSGGKHVESCKRFFLDRGIAV